MCNAALRAQPRMGNLAQLWVQNCEHLIERAALSLRGELQQLRERGIDPCHD
jgi:hypothetical protein